MRNTRFFERAPSFAMKSLAYRAPRSGKFERLQSLYRGSFSPCSKRPPADEEAASPHAHLRCTSLSSMVSFTDPFERCAFFVQFSNTTRP